MDRTVFLPVAAWLAEGRDPVDPRRLARVTLTLEEVRAALSGEDDDSDLAMMSALAGGVRAAETRRVGPLPFGVMAEISRVAHALADAFVHTNRRLPEPASHAAPCFCTACNNAMLHNTLLLCSEMAFLPVLEQRVLRRSDRVPEHISVRRALMGNLFFYAVCRARRMPRFMALLKAPPAAHLGANKGDAPTVIPLDDRRWRTPYARWSVDSLRDCFAELNRARPLGGVQVAEDAREQWMAFKQCLFYRSARTSIADFLQENVSTALVRREFFRVRADGEAFNMVTDAGLGSLTESAKQDVSKVNEMNEEYQEKRRNADDQVMARKFDEEARATKEGARLALIERTKKQYGTAYEEAELRVQAIARRIAAGEASPAEGGASSSSSSSSAAPEVDVFRPVAREKGKAKRTRIRATEAWVDRVALNIISLAAWAFPPPGAEENGRQAVRKNMGTATALVRAMYRDLVSKQSDPDLVNKVHDLTSNLALGPDEMVGYAQQRAEIRVYEDERFFLSNATDEKWLPGFPADSLAALLDRENTDTPWQDLGAAACFLYWAAQRSRGMRVEDVAATVFLFHADIAWMRLDRGSWNWDGAQPACESPGTACHLGATCSDCIVHRFHHPVIALHGEHWAVVSGWERRRWVGTRFEEAVAAWATAMQDWGGAYLWNRREREKVLIAELEAISELIHPLTATPPPAPAARSAAPSASPATR